MLTDAYSPKHSVDSNVVCNYLKLVEDVVLIAIMDLSSNINNISYFLYKQKTIPIDTVGRGKFVVFEKCTRAALRTTKIVSPTALIFLRNTI